MVSFVVLRFLGNFGGVVEFFEGVWLLWGVEEREGYEWYGVWSGWVVKCVIWWVIGVGGLIEREVFDGVE